MKYFDWFICIFFLFLLEFWKILSSGKYVLSSTLLAVQPNPTGDVINEELSQRKLITYLEPKWERSHLKITMGTDNGVLSKIWSCTSKWWYINIGENEKGHFKHFGKRAMGSKLAGGQRGSSTETQLNAGKASLLLFNKKDGGVGEREGSQTKKGEKVSQEEKKVHTVTLLPVVVLWQSLRCKYYLVFSYNLVAPGDK